MTQEAKKKRKPVSDTACKLAKGEDKKYRLYDRDGLYLEVMPNGLKYWRVKYYFLGKEKTMALGVYPALSLKDARKACLAARELLAKDIDPNNAKREKKRQAKLNAENTFEVVAREWHDQRKEVWSEVHAKTVLGLLSNNIFPRLGRRPISAINAPELLETLRIIEKRAPYLANRVKEICGQVFRYGVATGRNDRDPSHDLKGALKPTKVQHFAALDIKEVPDFLAVLEKNDARLYPRTRRAIKLLMLTFVRTSELIKASWDEFDLENGVWEIPAERMKMGKAHTVPLSKQAIALLKEQKEEVSIFKTCKWVFPSQVRSIQHMSNNTILTAIEALGYKGRMTGHGCRALAMTTIKEKLGYRHEIVDRQLAHAHGSKIDRAYDRAKFIDERIKMMQEWADYLDKVATEQSVPARQKAA